MMSIMICDSRLPLFIIYKYTYINITIIWFYILILILLLLALVDSPLITLMTSQYYCCKFIIYIISYNIILLLYVT